MSVVTTLPLDTVYISLRKLYLKIICHIQISLIYIVLSKTFLCTRGCTCLSRQVTMYKLIFVVSKLDM